MAGKPNNYTTTWKWMDKAYDHLKDLNAGEMRIMLLIGLDATRFIRSWTVSEMIQATGLSRNTVQSAVQTLRNKGIVDTVRHPVAKQRRFNRPIDPATL